MSKSSLDKFFYPKSIAVVGASTDPSKIGGYIFSEILKRSDIIKGHPINVKAPEVQGVRAYANVKEINHNVDLAIVAIPSAFVLETVEDCARSDIKNIVIISAGFKEAGEEGVQKEKELKELIAKYELNVVGPNCLGLLNPEIGLNCSFAKDVPKFGEIALISQSGAVIDAIIDWSFKHKIGFSKVVSMGNMAGVNELDMLNYLKEDKRTKAIVFYMETMEHGVRFGEVLREVTKTKPVILIKPGTSDNAKKAIGSHTGSLAQDNVLVQTLIRENNGILVETLNELFDVMIALKGKPNKNQNLVIITNAGGPGVIATDFAARTDFELYQIPDHDKNLLRKVLPAEASVNNPVDILGDGRSDRYFAALKVLLENRDIGNILILLTPQIMTDSEHIAKCLVDVSKKSKKNIFSSFIGDKEIKRGLSFFDVHDFPNFQTPGDALKAMNFLHEYKAFDYGGDVRQLRVDPKKLEKVKRKLSRESGLLSYELASQVLGVLGIEIMEKIVMKSADRIFDIKLDPKKSYVMKADGENLVHKKEVGGVVTDINSRNFEEEAAKMFDRIGKVSNDFTITLEEQVSGSEVICGLKNDEDLGNFIMFGMGGTFVSVFKDVNFSTCPLSVESAIDLVERSKVYTILKGFRGSKPINFKKLYDVLVRISYLEQIFPEIKEVDLNPVICNEKGVYLVDVKLLI